MEQTWDSQAAVGYCCFQIGCVFKYDLFNTTTLIQNYIYMNKINTVLYLFLETGTSDVLYVSFNAWDSQVSFYTPFYFSFTLPLRW